ncbi:MAG: hypothetical protein ACU88J_15650 [Gammaproteobacteria bacterium]
MSLLTPIWSMLWKRSGRMVTGVISWLPMPGKLFVLNTIRGLAPNNTPSLLSPYTSEQQTVRMHW